MVTQTLIKVLEIWWWLFLPFLLWLFFWRAWLFWRRELWEEKQKYVFFELKPPVEILKPFHSMEQILSSIWSIYSSLEGWKNFRKKWIVGRRLYHFSFEIVSVGPNPHFYLRINKEHSDTVQAALYSQFPEMEITAVSDYINSVPWTVPDKNWDLYGFDLYPVKEDVYPIKTFTQFFEVRPESTKEEKRVDPLNVLLEGLNQLKEGEQIWIQIKAIPISPKDENFVKRGKRLVAKLTFRREEKPKSIVKEILAPTVSKKGEEEKAFIPPEMKLTPREREVVKAIEDKIGKPVFRTNIRCIYFGKRDIFQAKRRTLAEQYFSSFSLPDLNTLKKWIKTKTKVWHFFVKRRTYLRKRRIFLRYLLREEPFYPRRGGNFILSTEELASIFHLPLKLQEVGTFLPRVEARKAEPPPGLPMG